MLPSWQRNRNDISFANVTFSLLGTNMVIIRLVPVISILSAITDPHPLYRVLESPPLPLVGGKGFHVRACLFFSISLKYLL